MDYECSEIKIYWYLNFIIYIRWIYYYCYMIINIEKMKLANFRNLMILYNKTIFQFIFDHNITHFLCSWYGINA